MLQHIGSRLTLNHNQSTIMAPAEDPYFPTRSRRAASSSAALSMVIVSGESP